ncbi:hypothetical protein Ptr902_03992 [Pyrenophora tritici-repentis]|nr:hypothetical protein Ptr902_03992 [Pyrenophora tritici-repentis]
MRHHGEPKTSVLSAHERSQLWSDELLSPWCWADPNEKEDCLDEKFPQALEEAISKDGFRVSLVTVWGVDCLDSTTELQHRGELWEESVFSDAGRALEQHTDNGTPVKLHHYLNWKIQSEVYERLLARIEQGEFATQVITQLLYPLQAQIIERDFQKPEDLEKQARNVLSVSLRESGHPWMCKNRKDPEIVVRFVPARSLLLAQGMSDLSSAYIRNIVEIHGPDGAGEILVDALTGKALNPIIFESMLESKRRIE